MTEKTNLYGSKSILRYWCQSSFWALWLIYGPLYTFLPINNKTQLPVTMNLMKRNGCRVLRGKLKVTRTFVCVSSTRVNTCQTIRNFRATKAQWMTSFVQPFQINCKWMLIEISNHKHLMARIDMHFRYCITAPLLLTAGLMNVVEVSMTRINL
jgi:hypothetical protein